MNFYEKRKAKVMIISGTIFLLFGILLFCYAFPAGVAFYKMQQYFVTLDGKIEGFTSLPVYDTDKDGNLKNLIGTEKATLVSFKYNNLEFSKAELDYYDASLAIGDTISFRYNTVTENISYGNNVEFPIFLQIVSSIASSLVTIGILSIISGFRLKKQLKKLR